MLAISFFTYQTEACHIQQPACLFVSVQSNSCNNSRSVWCKFFLFFCVTSITPKTNQFLYIHTQPQDSVFNGYDGIWFHELLKSIKLTPKPIQFDFNVKHAKSIHLTLAITIFTVWWIAMRSFFHFKPYTKYLWAELLRFHPFSLVCVRVMCIRYK